MLVALVVSCSSDDAEPNNGKENNKGMIDEKILGKWKVEHSKTIKGARFLEDGTLEIAENAIITEYLGNWGEVDVVPKSSMFGDADVWVEIKKDLTIDAYHTSPTSSGFKPKTTTFDSIKDGLFIKIYGYPDKTHKLKYWFDKERLIIETITPELKGYYYTISEYSKIKE